MGLLVDHRRNRNQQLAMAAKGGTRALGCIQHNSTSRSGEGIIPLPSGFPSSSGPHNLGRMSQTQHLLPFPSFNFSDFSDSCSTPLETVEANRLRFHPSLLQSPSGKLEPIASCSYLARAPPRLKVCSLAEKAGN